LFPQFCSTFYAVFHRPENTRHLHQHRYKFGRNGLFFFSLFPLPSRRIFSSFFIISRPFVRANEFANIPYARVYNSSCASNKRSRRAALAERDNNVKSIVEFGDCATPGRKLISDATFFCAALLTRKHQASRCERSAVRKTRRTYLAASGFAACPLYTLFEVSFFPDRFCPRYVTIEFRSDRLASDSESCRTIMHFATALENTAQASLDRGKFPKLVPNDPPSLNEVKRGQAHL